MENEPEGDPENVKMRKAYSRIQEQSDEQLREIIANTFGQLSFIDDNVGRLLNALADAGLDENTYVIYTSDHGDWLGDHGLVLKGPMHYEGLLRVPMLVRGPGVPAGKVVDEPVSTIDIGPTLYDIAGATALQTQHGQSLRPLLEEDGHTRDYAMNEWELLPIRVGVALSLRTVRTRTHKLTMDLRSETGELYDLVNDPDEMVNLFDDPAAADIRAQLVDYLMRRPDDIGPNRVPVGPA